MNNQKKPNIKLLTLVAFIILLNILIIVFALLGNGELVIALLGFNFVVVVIAYFVLLAKKRADGYESDHDEDNDKN